MNKLYRTTITDVTNHKSRASVRKHSGIHTVTAGLRTADAAPSGKPSPFGKLVLGAEAGAKPTAYKSIFGL
jgi:hypothetical protein